MHPMNEFFAKLSKDAGVTEISIVSDGALRPRSCASSTPKSPSKSGSKKDGKQQKFGVATQEDRAPLPPRKWETTCLIVNENQELLEPTMLHDSHSSMEEIHSTTRPCFEALACPSADAMPIRPPTAPRRKESIDETGLFFEDPSTSASDVRLNDLATSSLGLRLAAARLDGV